MPVIYIPPINLNEFIPLLKSEGSQELRMAINAEGTIKFGRFQIFTEWNNIILILEKEVIPLLEKGCDAEKLLVPGQKLAKSTAAISLMATELLSFVPGPIGIVCSFGLAIVHFSSGDIVGGLFELLGCIPGGKVAGKSASKLFSKIKPILVKAVENNYNLKNLVAVSAKTEKLVTEFIEKYGPKTKTKSKYEMSKDYGVKSSARQQSSLEESLSRPFNPAVEAQKEIGKYTIFPGTYGNIGKTNLWPHL